jgi:protein tyrosine/serine phosphatase
VAAARADKTNLPNFAEVAPGIYRGAAPTPAGLRRLKALGVDTVIDLRIENRGQTEEAEAARRLGLNRVRLRMGREAPTSAQVQTLLAALDNARERPVFVHCQHGADRTGAMIGIYRVTRQNWDWSAHLGRDALVWLQAVAERSEAVRGSPRQKRLTAVSAPNERD